MSPVSAVQEKNINVVVELYKKITIEINMATDNPNMDKGLEKTVYFELLWLKNKHQFYQEITNEDNDRIKMLEARWEELSK